ncbi:hypothetical protein [Polaribacter aquimarinus]|uniref:Uncharacterized protein n=1 Tax=Polaribacter aquimarinus TaxID=2100726 RepID=A0A2U2JD60_9FLAO|nr:hypothetical protein [Polaribacter aquimarinus]PWG06278.1 hypothetical protein DIS07_00150 [Polaribacter aquimarinus]
MKFSFIIFLIFITSITYSQRKLNLEITFKNGKVIQGDFNVSIKKIEDAKTKKEYNYDSITTMIIDKKNPRLDAYIINIKKNVNSKKILQGIGYIIHQNKHLELYQVAFHIKDSYQSNISREFRKGSELYIKRKNESYAFNIGFIDGKGWHKIKKRVITFFKDCPKIVKYIKQGKLDVKETIKLIDFYNEYCYSNIKN